MKTRRTTDDNKFYISLGARIRIAREIRGMTQSVLGRGLGITRTSIINIEQGRQGIPLHQFVKLAHRLGVSYRILLEGTGQPGKPTSKPPAKLNKP